MQTLVCADPTCQTPPGEVGVSDPRIRDVRFWHKADVQTALTNVRFEGGNGHDADVTRCLVMTQRTFRR